MISLRKLFVFQQWFIAFRRKQPVALPLQMEGFQAIQPPAGRFYADPFIMEHEGRNYIFFEDYRLRSRKGVISCIEISEKGETLPPRVVLEKEHHLAYPFLLKTSQGIFMIPDTSANRTVELYEAVRFPEQWTLKKVIMRDIRASDTTLFPYGGKWWLFTNVMSPYEQTGKGELCVFYADSPWGEWQPHPQNPVNQDARTARPAGNLFFHEGKIIRPAQNCAVEYGASLIMNEITRLSEMEYAESALFEMGPQWQLHNKKLHTYNGNEQWEVIDGLREVIDFLKPFRWLASYIAR